MSSTSDPDLRRHPRPDPARHRLLRLLPALLAVIGLSVLAGCAGGTRDVPPPPVPAPVAAAELTQADVDAWLDGLLPAALERTGIPGAGVTVVHEGRVLTARGYGWADTGDAGHDPVPVDPERTLFRPGSVSKLLTATAVVQLVERGQLDLDADVRGYLDFDPPLTRPTPVTLRHLLTHTAGFEERVDGLISLTDSGVDLREALATDPPEQVYDPGTVPAYSNYGNALAGYVVQRVTGVPFAEHVRRSVLEPAGMTSSSFAQPLPPELRERMARGYPTSADPATPFEYVELSPAGGLSAPPTDMARFMLAQLGEPVTGRPLMGRDALELMHRPALDAGSLGTLAEAPRMTLGFFSEDRNGHRILGHGGDTQVFHSHLQLYPDERTGIYLSLNGSGAGPADSLELREAVMHGFTDRYLPAGQAPAPSTVDPATSEQHAQQVAGSYRSSRSMHSTFLATLDLLGPTQVTAQPGGRLLLAPGPGTVSPVLYEEVEPWLWREVGGQRELGVRLAGQRVEAIGYDSAFALLPAEPARAPGLALPVIGLSTLLLLGAAVSWLVRALVRWRRPRADTGAGPRLPETLVRVGVVSTLVALVGWVVTITVAMGLQPVPTSALRVLQLLQALGVLAVVPAALVLVGRVRRRAGWRAVAGAALVLLGLAGTAWFAFAFRLLSASVSY